MDTISYAEARQNLVDVMQETCTSHKPVVITRRKAESVVMMSLDDYQALEETIYLLRSPKNAEKLLQSLDDAQNGKVFEYNLDD